MAQVESSISKEKKGWYKFRWATQVGVAPQEGIPDFRLRSSRPRV